MKALLILSLCVVATLGFYRYIQGHILESTPLGGSTGLFSGVYWNSWGGQVYSGAYTGIHGGVSTSIVMGIYWNSWGGGLQVLQVYSGAYTGTHEEGVYRYIQGPILELMGGGRGVYKYSQGHILKLMGGSQVYSGAYTGIHGGGWTSIFRGVYWISLGGVVVAVFLQVY